MRGSRGGIGIARWIALAVLALAAAALAGPAQAAAASSFTARGSAEQLYVTHAKPGAKVTLLRKGEKLRKDAVNELGAVLFRRLDPGGGYVVRVAGEGKSGKLEVLSNRSAPPDESVYDQQIPSSGYGYLKTRDGTKLSIYVHPAEDVSKAFGITLPELPAGPRPTLIEYAGYGYANPDGPESGISLIANLMGFTVVDVNMRGTGCSGGAYDFFEPLQSLDGYDVVETIARQPWVANGKVGMMGISYGGISQLFTAATKPPSLAAITPLSVLDQVQTTLFPGGVLNTGFALEWAKDRIYDAKPAGPNGGQEWAYEKIQQGDELCKENQALHGEAVNLLRKIKRNKHYRPKVADPLSPVTFVDEIDVPTFMACQWTDEQTGGHCANLADRFTGTDKKWFTFTNGTHVDSLSPEVFNRWYDFLKLYVAKQAPITNSAVMQAAAPIIYEEAMGISGVTLPPDPVQQQPTYAGALAEFEKQQPVRILFDNGAGGSNAGEPYPGYERSFPSFPIPGTKAKSWFFASRGELAAKAPKKRAKGSFAADPHSTEPTNFTGDTGAGDLWTAIPSYHWTEHPDKNALSWITSPLGDDTTVVGAGAVKAWVRSAKRNVDLQATISEVRPDGKEVFVQGGWLRANERKLDRKKSSKLEPVLSLREKHVKPMPKGRFAKVTIPLYYEGHAYRKGSQIRVTISGFGGDQPIWAFEHAKPAKGSTRVAIASSKRRPSKLTLPVIGGGIPTALPPCPGLRGEPCREYSGG